MLNIRECGKASVVELPARLILGDGDEELRQAVQTLLDGGTSHIILNMERVAFMDSAGLAQTVSCHKRAIERGGGIKIAKPSQKIRDLFTITKLDRVFDLYDGEQRAIASF
jgi:anti-sigma B factor antagonist